MNPTTQLGPVLRRRAALPHSTAALARGQLTVGFLGGSITDPSTGNRWPEALVGWLVDAHPHARITVENAALGATGSDLAAVRVQEAILARRCDLVFVEYAANDFGTEPKLRERTREGVLRQLLAAGNCDVVIVYTYFQEMLTDMLAGKVPPSIADFELLAEHYRLNSVWMALHALRENERGLMTWEEWLPDGLHPESRGSLSYAQSVIAFLAETLARPPAPVVPAALPPPRSPDAWEHIGFVPFEAIERRGSWSVRRCETCRGINQVLISFASGAGLKFDFEGRGLVLGFDFGRSSGEIRYRIDGGEWQTSRRDYPSWAGAAGWLRAYVVTDQLARGRHAFELEALPGSIAEVRGVRTSIGFFAVIK